MDKNTYKIVLIGDANSGKTTFLKYVMTGNIEPKYIATIGVDVRTISNISDDKTFVFWDTAGNPKHRGLADGYYIGADLALIFVEHKSNIENAKRHILEFKRVCPEKDYIIVRSKSDSDTITPYNLSLLNSASVDELLIRICMKLNLKINRNTIMDGKLVKHVSLNTIDCPLINCDSSCEDEIPIKPKLLLTVFSDDLSEYETEFVKLAENYGVEVEYNPYMDYYA